MTGQKEIISWRNSLGRKREQQRGFFVQLFPPRPMAFPEESLFCLVLRRNQGASLPTELHETAVLYASPCPVCARGLANSLTFPRWTLVYMWPPVLGYNCRVMYFKIRTQMLIIVPRDSRTATQSSQTLVL